MKLFCILSTNPNLEAIAWGPFQSRMTAKAAKKRLEKAYPRANHLVLRFQDMELIPKANEEVKDDG